MSMNQAQWGNKNFAAHVTDNALTPFNARNNTINIGISQKELFKDKLDPVPIKNKMWLPIDKNRHSSA